MVDSHSFDDLEVAEIIGLQKVTASALAWGRSPENMLFTHCRSPLEDASGVQLAGLLLELQFREGVVVDRCKYSFALWAIRKGHRHLVMRLDVGPWDKCTHKDGKSRFRGAHLHIGKKVLPIAKNGLSCKDHADWFQVFCRLANIQHDLPYRNPYEFELEMSS